MAKGFRPGFNYVRRPAKWEPHNDPAVLTANSQAEAKAFMDLLRRSRAAGGHDEDALKSDRPVRHGLPNRDAD